MEWEQRMEQRTVCDRNSNPRFYLKLSVDSNKYYFGKSSCALLLTLLVWSGLEVVQADGSVLGLDSPVEQTTLLTDVSVVKSHGYFFFFILLIRRGTLVQIAS